MEDRVMSIPTYRNYKIRMLERDFCIKLTDEEKKHFNELTTYIQMDQFTASILNNRWD